MAANAPAVQAAIFDLDGTLVDTNDAHVEAWLAAFRDFGYHVPRSRILPEIGKGGDKLVPSILGEDSDEQDGEALRNAHGRHFVTMAKDTIFRVFPATEELLSELRRRSIATAVATSSTKAHLNATLDSSGLDLDRLVDHIVPSGPALDSKPAPDLIQAALEKLASDPQRTIMIGDTPHDGEACARAGVPFVGLLCGGGPPDDLSRAGALALSHLPCSIFGAASKTFRKESNMTSKALGALMLSGLFFVGPAVAQQGSPPPGGSPSSPAQPGTPGAPSSGTPTDTPKTPAQQGKPSKGKSHKKSSLKPCAPGTMSTPEAPCSSASGTTK